MTKRYFRVDTVKGAFIDGFHYAEGEIVVLDLGAKDKAPRWGTEVDASGSQIGATATPNAALDAMGDGLANKIANGSPAASNQGSEEGTGAVSPEVRKEQIKEALTLLDHANNDHWTSNGQPKVDTLNAILGYDVTRKEIEEVDAKFGRVIPDNVPQE